MPELTWELMFAFLALLFIGIIFAIMTSLGGGLQQFNIFGCEENPPAWKFWCRVSEAEEPDYLIAKQSFQALACAINAVAQGNPQLCSGYSVTQAAFPIAFAQEEKATVECEEIETREYEDWKIYVPQKDSENFCNEYANTFKLKGKVIQEKEKLIEWTDALYFESIPYLKIWALECVCEDKTTNRQISIAGANRRDVLQKCRNYLQTNWENIALSSCTEKEFSGNTLNNLEKIIDYSDKAFMRLQKCTCQLEKNNEIIETYPIYGGDLNEIENKCRNDAESDPDLSFGGLKDCEWIEGSFLLYNTGLEENKNSENFFECVPVEKKTVKCTVKNFNLPQKVSKAEEWIAGYGDPKFLVYWQKFPAGEDAAWSGYRTWLEDTFVFFLFILPGATSLVKGIFKTSEKFVAWTGLKITEEISKKLTGRGVRLAKEGTKLAEKVNKKVAETGLSSLERYLFCMEEVSSKPSRIQKLKEAFTLDSALKKISEKLEKKLAEKVPATSLKDIMKLTGAATLTGVVAAYLDSVNEKFIPQPEKLVLKRPYRDLDLEDLSTERKPVLLDKRGLASIKEKIKGHVNFYLASPCFANLEVRKGMAKCSLYSYDKKTGMVYCNSSIFTTLSWNLPSCEFSEEIDKISQDYVSKNIYEKINEIISSGDYRFFEGSKIYIPWYGKNVYIKDLPDESGTALLWENGKLGMKNVVSEKDYVLNKGRVYRIKVYKQGENIILDIVPKEKCENVEGIDCQELTAGKKGVLTKIDQIKAIIEGMNSKEEDIIEVQPEKSITAEELLLSGYKFSENCEEGKNKICFRSSEISVRKQENEYWFFDDENRQCISFDLENNVSIPSRGLPYTCVGAMNIMSM